MKMVEAKPEEANKKKKDVMCNVAQTTSFPMHYI